MISVLEEFKKQIKDIKLENCEENEEEVLKLKKIVEIKNKEREKLLKENLRLTQMADEKLVKMKIEEVSRDLRKQIADNEEIEKKIEQLEEVLSFRLNRSCIETRAFTDRSVMYESGQRSSVRKTKGTEVKITNSLAMAIEQAQVTLNKSKKEITRSISPCFSYNSLKSESPSKIKRMNTSLIYNN